jgi:hypothetical protein
VLTELFADQPQTTIASGGTDVPAPGTTQTLTPVSGTGFPAVSAASNSQFHIADPAVDAKTFGAKGDGATDDTSALAAWIDAINQASGTFAALPPGRYMISGPLPKILAKSVVIVGCGWSYTDSRYGSVIAALSSYNPNSSSSPMLWLDGEGNRLEGICVDGGGYASTVISVTGGHAQLTRVQARHAASDGTCIASTRRRSHPLAACARETTPGSAPASTGRTAHRRSAGGTWSRPTGPATRPSPTFRGRAGRWPTRQPS